MFQFPFGTLHQLNLDWFLGEWENYKQEWADAQAGIDNALQGEIDRVEDAMTDLYNARDVAVQAKEDAETAAGSAVSDAAQAGADALKSEGYAVGEQDGIPVGSGSPYYQSNAKYYKVEAGTYRYLSEAYAKGEMGGSPVAPGEAGYQDNAKYYKGLADADATQTAADRVQTGLDRAAVSQDKDDTDLMKSAANAAALRAEGWAIGEQNGTPVAAGSDYYNNNAKYYKELAEIVANSLPPDYVTYGDTVKSLSQEVFIDDSANHSWVQGTFSRPTGANLASTKALRNVGSITKQTGIFKVVTATGYKMSVWAWDAATGDFIGHIQSDGNFGTDSTYLFYHQFIFNYDTGYRYRIVLYNEDNTLDITTAEGVNVSWFIGKVDPLYQNSTLSDSPEFGTVNNIFTNNDSAAQPGIDNGLLNSVCVVKISDSMYYMYYHAAAYGETGYANESLCFAYSTDGLNFIKSFPSGVIPPYLDNRILPKGTIHGVCVILVPDDDYPFRMIGVDAQNADRIIVMYKSADGANWTYMKDITRGYNDSFVSCVLRGDIIKMYLRSRTSAGERIIVTLITDINGNHISPGWTQAISLNNINAQLYQAAASKLDDNRDLLIPTIYNPADSSETVKFMIVDNGHYDLYYPSVSAVIDSSVKSIYFAPNIVGIGTFTYAFYTTRSTDHDNFDNTTISKINRVRIMDNTIPEIVRP